MSEATDKEPLPLEAVTGDDANAEWRAQYNTCENIAVGLAAIEASSKKQNVPVSQLEDGTCKFYAAQLKEAHTKYVPFKNSTQKNTGVLWTMELSMQRRPAHGGLWERWKRGILPYLIKITPHYYQITAGTHDILSGKQLCDLVHAIKKRLWDEEQKSKAAVQARARARATARTSSANGAGVLGTHATLD
eukprot:193665-Pleurochrysis_carterae.AAC.1